MVVEVRLARIRVARGKIGISCDPALDVLAPVPFPPTLGKSVKPEVSVCHDAS
jgi:hypothetical protein